MFVQVRYKETTFPSKLKVKPYKLLDIGYMQTAFLVYTTLHVGRKRGIQFLWIVGPIKAFEH